MKIESVSDDDETPNFSRRQPKKSTHKNKSPAIGGLGKMKMWRPSFSSNASSVNRRDQGVMHPRLIRSIFYATQVIDEVATDGCGPYRWQTPPSVGHPFTASTQATSSGKVDGTLVHGLKTWLHAHEEAQVDHQLTDSDSRAHRLVATSASFIREHLARKDPIEVMLASVLVVVGLWWMVRTVLTLLINLICPLLVVLMAVILVPQLRAPLLGQNYPALMNVLRGILINLADNIKPPQ